MRLGTLRFTLFFIITLSVLTIILGFVAYKNSLIALGVWNDSNRMLVFLKPDTTPAERTQLTGLISTHGTVLHVKEIDRQSAGASFQKSLKEYGSGLLTDDELIDLIPETLEIELKPDFKIQDRHNAFKELDLLLKKENVVDAVSYSSTWVEKFAKVDRFIRSAGTFIFVIVISALSFLVSLMIRAYVDDSKSEIEVYNLLGATRWSIYKLYLRDMCIFLSASLLASGVFSYLIFILIRDKMSRAGLAAMISDNLVFLNIREMALLSLVLSALFISHSFFTIYMSVNRLNQITND